MEAIGKDSNTIQGSLVRGVSRVIAEMTLTSFGWESCTRYMPLPPHHTQLARRDGKVLFMRHIILSYASHVVGETEIGRAWDVLYHGGGPARLLPVVTAILGILAMAPFVFATVVK